MPMIAVARKQQGKRVSPRRIVMEQLRIRTNYERKLERQVFNLLERTSRDSSKAFAESGRTPEITSFASELRSILDPHYRDVLEKFALMVLENQKQTPAIDRLIQQFLKTQGANAIRNITSSTRSKIKKIVRKGNQSGSSADSIARSIREGTGGLIARNRAATIARTETHNAASFAQMEIAKESLPQDGLLKQWVSVSDSRTRDAHSRANGQTVGIDEKFELVVGGIKYFMDRPADPNGGPANVVNCRCAVVFVYPEDEIEGDDPSRSKIPQPVAITREKIDLSDLPKVRGFTDDVRQEATKVLNNHPDPIIGNAIAKVLLENKGNVVMQKRGKIGLCQAFNGSRKIVITADPFEENGSVQVHEWGHAIDRYLGFTEGGFLSGRGGKHFWTQGDEFTDALNADRKKYGVISQGRHTAKFKREMAEKYIPLLNKFFDTKRTASGAVRYTFKDGRDGNFSDIIDAIFVGRPFEDAKVFGHGAAYYKKSGMPQAEVWANMADLYGTDYWPKVKEVVPNMARVFEKKIKEFIK